MAYGARLESGLGVKALRGSNPLSSATWSRSIASGLKHASPIEPASPVRSHTPPRASASPLSSRAFPPCRTASNCPTPRPGSCAAGRRAHRPRISGPCTRVIAAMRPEACNLLRGGVSERPKEHASKACVGATSPWVQIPPPPPRSMRAPDGASSSTFFD